jgi:hypothetical protein
MGEAVMTKQREPADGSWLLADELLQRGDPAFVDELRRIHDPDRLGAFAARWYGMAQPDARRLLFDYLDQPLNAFRHEPLVKRLFKLAEQAGDDEVMARFLVAFDRSVRRARRRRRRYDWTLQESWAEESIHVPAASVMPRDRRHFSYRNPRTGEPIPVLTGPSSERLRLFSVHTRYYLRRRAWRYFRKLGKERPERYVRAVVPALKLYTDADVADGLALLDNWGLVHALFHDSPALVARANGWTLAEGHKLGELAPAPMYEPLWQASPLPLIELIKQARCRPVRQWAVQMLRRMHADALGRLPLPDLIALLNHEDADIAALAAAALRNATGLGTLNVEQWLALLGTTNSATIETLCELMVRYLQPGAIDLTQAVKLACSRPVPVARLGLTWLRAKQPATPDECRAVLTVAEAEADSVRGELIGWVRGVLGPSPHFTPDWVLQLLDSRHADVRAEAWQWFQDEPRAREDVTLWQRLLESPYDDIRLRLVAALDDRVAAGAALSVNGARLDPELVRFLWASVLLNVYRGGRSKPVVVGQIVRRLHCRPQEAPQLLPVLSVALRSVRGPEWRAGLAGVMQLMERSPQLESTVRAAFPELSWTGV